MSATIIDGKQFAQRVRDDLRERVRNLRDFHRVQVGLAVVLVGEDPASEVYVRNKHKAADEVGVKSFPHKYTDDITEEQLLAVIRGLNDDPAVHGILVQLPLPRHIDDRRVIEEIAPEKDVDGFHPINVGRLSAGLDAMVPCTPWGCLTMLEDYYGEEGLSGKDAVVIGRSNIVGKPMAQLLLSRNCTVTIAHSRTENIAAVCRRADVVVAAVGVAHMVKADWVKPGAAVIDVGMNRIPKDDGDGTRLVGDVDFDAVKEVAGAITPVPGGVGPMTIAMLIRNTVTACARIHGITDDAVVGPF